MNQDDGIAVTIDTIGYPRIPDEYMLRNKGLHSSHLRSEKVAFLSDRYKLFPDHCFFQIEFVTNVSDRLKDMKVHSTLCI